MSATTIGINDQSYQRLLHLVEQTGRPVLDSCHMSRLFISVERLDAWTAEWNKIYFNQGAPKPGGTYPGLTRPVTGTYNRRTRAFEITWYSAIVGGPFSGFTGFWHLQGKIKAS